VEENVSEFLGGDEDQEERRRGTTEPGRRPPARPRGQAGAERFLQLDNTCRRASWSRIALPGQRLVAVGPLPVTHNARTPRLDLGHACDGIAPLRLREGANASDFEWVWMTPALRTWSAS
jgi:hypothetical protein